MKISKGKLRKIILEYLSLNEEIKKAKGFGGYEYEYDTATKKIKITKAPDGVYKGVVNPEKDDKNEKAYESILNMHFPEYAGENSESENSDTSTSNSGQADDVENVSDENVSYYDTALPLKVSGVKKINFVEFLKQIENSNASGEYVYNYDEFKKLYSETQEDFDSFTSNSYNDIDKVIDSYSFLAYDYYEIYRSSSDMDIGGSLNVNVFFEPDNESESSNDIKGRLFFDLPGQIDNFILNNVKYNKNSNSFSIEGNTDT